MRELRVQSGGRPLRLFYTFDPRRSAILPFGGDKTPCTTRTSEEIRKEVVDPVTGHKPFNKLTKNFTPKRRARVAAKAAALREVMTLEELRKTHSLSPKGVAKALTVGQAAVAKRGDMHVGDLRRYVEALGGTLEITAHFAGTAVVVGKVGEST